MLINSTSFNICTHLENLIGDKHFNIVVYAGKEEDGGSAALIVAIVCVLLFTALLITVLFVSAIVLYLIHRNRKGKESVH